MYLRRFTPAALRLLAGCALTLAVSGVAMALGEPSGDPARLQMFHQREIVRIGEPEVVADWRDSWRERAVSLLQSVGLDVNDEVASDPFFGRSGRLLARSRPRARRRTQTPRPRPPTTRT